MSILYSFILEGKTAIVTGCKRGIGKRMSIALAEADANIIGVSASLELSASEIEKEVSFQGNFGFESQYFLCFLPHPFNNLL